MDKIFISYARGDDEPFVKRLYESLTKAGFDVWFDRVSMPSRALTFHQEIRDAINARERLILVVGPKAIVSDYVTQEWQFAYFAANKCVNPIIRLDGLDAGGNRVDGYSLIPEDLRLLHAEDFRDDSQFSVHIDNLIRQLSESMPPVGKLVAVPELPHGYQAQPERLKVLRDLLLLDLQKPVVVTGAAARVGLQGMGGIGKSVLANAMARHPQVRRAFQDGIYWVTLGQQPRIEELQRQLAVALGGDGQFDNRQTGKEQLRQLLADRASLIVLDDVWERDHADAFNVVGARSRILLTTRDAGLVTALAAKENHYRVELPTLAEARAILGGAAEIPQEQLPLEAGEIIEECGRLPLALALCGGMVQGGTSWASVFEALREHDLEYLSIEYPDEAQHQNAWKAMDISLRVLPTDEQQRFAELAVFDADTGAPDAAVATLWQHTANLTPRQSDALLAKFTRRSLVQRPSVSPDRASARVDLHNLLHHFATGMATHLFGSINSLHQQLLDAYRKECPDGWHTGPDDGYFIQNLVKHIAGIGDWPGAEALVTDFPWLMRKCELGLLDSISSDYALLAEQAPAEAIKRLDVWQAFFREKAHILRRGNEEWPVHKILLQLAIEDADDSPLTIAAEKWLEEDRCDWIWLRRNARLAHFQKNPCLATLEGHISSVNGAMELSDGRLLSWSEDGALRIWDSRSGKCLVTLDGHTGPIIGAIELIDGRLLSWSEDWAPRLWDSRSGKCLANLEGHTDYVKGALKLADGRLLSWSEDGALRIWDSRSGKCLVTLEGHTGIIYGVLELIDGRLLSWSGDRTLRIWDSHSGACLANLEGHTDYIKGALKLADGSLLSWSGDRTLRIWDSRSGACLASLEGHTGPIIGAMELSNQRLLSWGDMKLRLWDSRSGVCLLTLEGHTGLVWGALELSDGRLLSWGDMKLRLWDSRSGKCLVTLEGHTGWVSGALELTDGRLLSWSGDGTLRIWDSRSGTCLVTLEGHKDLVMGTLELSDGRLLSWSMDDTLRIWDRWSGKCLVTLEGHKDLVMGTLELGDGRLLSWSMDDTLRIWDRWRGACLATLEGHTDSVAGVLELSDGRLLSWSRDGLFRLWDSGSGACLQVEPLEDVNRHHPEFGLAIYEKRKPDCVIGEFFITSSNQSRSAELYLRTFDGSLANWNSEVPLQTRELFHDGTTVATLESGQVCFLNLYHGNRRISLDELEELLRSEGRIKKDDAVNDGSGAEQLWNGVN